MVPPGYEIDEDWIDPEYESGRLAAIAEYREASRFRGYVLRKLLTAGVLVSPDGARVLTELRVWRRASRRMMELRWMALPIRFRLRRSR